MMNVTITGVKEVDAMLKGLSGKAAERISSAALSGGTTVLRREMRKAAPVGKTGKLKKSIGSRNEKDKRTGVRSAKAGINVGRQRKTTIRAPHGHLVALGTNDRYTDQGFSRGAMPKNDFIRDATAKAQGQLHPAMIARAKKALARELEKAKRGKR